MKLILKFLLTMCVIIVITLYVSQIHNHVIILVGQYRLDLSLVSLIILIILIYIVIYWLYKILYSSYHIPHKINQWWYHRSYNNGIKYCEKAILYYLSGTYLESYKNAKQALIKPINNSTKFLVTILAYITAGHLAYDKEQYILDNQLTQYQKESWRITKLLVNAENNYLQGKFELCLDNLHTLFTLDKNHITAKILQIRAYMAIHNFNDAYNILEELSDQRVHSKALTDLSYKVYIGICTEAQNLQQLELISYRILQTPHNIHCIHEYLHALIRLQEYTLVIDLLAHHNELMSDKLINLAKLIPTSSQIQQLIQIFELRNNNIPNNVIVIFCLGILYFRIQNFMLAKQFLTASMQISSNSDILVYLFSTAVALNDTELTLNLRQQLNLGYIA